MTVAYLTVEQVAERMHCEARTVRRAIARGDLEAAFIGRRWIIRETSVEAWFESKRASAKVVGVRRRELVRGSRRPPSLDRDYAGVIRELEDQPRVPAADAIRHAREQANQQRRTG